MSNPGTQTFSAFPHPPGTPRRFSQLSASPSPGKVAAVKPFSGSALRTLDPGRAPRRLCSELTASATNS